MFEHLVTYISIVGMMILSSSYIFFARVVTSTQMIYQNLCNLYANDIPEFMCVIKIAEILSGGFLSKHLVVVAVVFIKTAACIRGWV